MKGNDARRAAIRALAARETGLPIGQERVMAAHQAIAGRESQAQRLPVIPAAYDIQDPLTGAFYFMVDFDPVDSPDIPLT